MENIDLHYSGIVGVLGTLSIDRNETFLQAGLG
jgi:hypothetical protein